jgi:hypothetical protein
MFVAWNKETVFTAEVNYYCLEYVNEEGRGAVIIFVFINRVTSLQLRCFLSQGI